MKKKINKNIKIGEIMLKVAKDFVKYWAPMVLLVIAVSVGWAEMKKDVEYLRQDVIELREGSVPRGEFDIIINSLKDSAVRLEKGLDRMEEKLDNKQEKYD